MGKFSVGAAMLAMMPLMAPITAGAAGLAPLQPGLWEMQVSGVVQAGPGLQQSFSRSNQVCVRPGEQDRNQPYIPQERGTCTTGEHTDADGTVRWTMHCAVPEGKMDGVGTVEAAPDHFTSRWQVTTTMEGPEAYSAITTGVIQGRRVGGQCPPGS